MVQPMHRTYHTLDRLPGRPSSWKCPRGVFGWTAERRLDENAATVVLSIALAFAFGYGLTMRGVLHAGLGQYPGVREA
jgi:hypothetical protein